MIEKLNKVWNGTKVEAGFGVEVVSGLFIVSMAFWTLLTNSVVYFQGSFTTLYHLSPLVIIALVITALLALFKFIEPAKVRNQSDENQEMNPNQDTVFQRILPIFLATLILSLYGITNNEILFWVLACLFLVFFYVQNIRDSHEELNLPEPVQGNLLVLLILLTSAILATLIIHRTHGDDAFYLNLIVGALDFSDRPLLMDDTMHGIEGMPILLPVYRVHSIEMLAAVISQATGISYLLIRNFWQPLVMAPFLVCASAVLLRVLTPRHWLTLTIVTTIITIIFTVSAGLGNNSFGRLQQGKPLFVSIVVPIIIAYTIRYFQRPSLKSWLILSLSNIAAIGCTSTALYAAPLTTIVTLVGCWYPTFKATRKAFIALLAAFYPMLLSIGLFFQVKTDSPNISNLNTEKILTNDEVLQLQYGLSAYLFWLAVLASWSVFQDSERRRIILGMIGFFMLVFMNPFLQEFWATHLTGVPTFRRLWWVIPRHILVILLISFPLIYPFWQKDRQRKRNLAAFLGTLTLGLIILISSASPNPYSPDIDYNRSLSYSWPPKPKLPIERLKLIDKMRETIPPHSYVLAPALPADKSEAFGDELSRWFIVERNHPYPIIVTDAYLDQLGKFFGPSEVEKRQQLSRYISGVERHKSSANLLRESVIKLNISTVIIPQINPWKEEIGEVMSSLGYHSQMIDKYQLWQSL